MEKSGNNLRLQRGKLPLTFHVACNNAKYNKRTVSIVNWHSSNAHKLITTYFVTASLTNNLTEDVLDRYYLLPEVIPSTNSPGSSSGETTHARKEVTPASSPTNSTQAYIGLITGVLAMVVLLLACTVFLMIRRGRKKVALLHKHTALVSSSTKPTTINMKDLKHMSTPIINNGLSRSRISVKSKTNTLGTVDTKKQKKCNLYGNVAGEESDSENSSVYHEPYKLLPNTKQEYGCLLKKDGVASSKSGEYTGKKFKRGWRKEKIMKGGKCGFSLYLRSTKLVSGSRSS